VALWLLLAGVAAMTASALYAILHSLDLNFNLFHITPLLALAFHLDKLSSFFVIVIGVVSTCAVIYSMSYIEHYAGSARVQILAALLAFFILTMMLVVTSASTFGFLFFWELMSLSSFLLVMFDREKTETQKAGLFYFAMTQLGTLFLFTAFLLVYRFTGSFDISFASGIPEWGKGLVFVSLFVGFGTKAGIIPFHKWLPYAHSASPSNVSALMSGVMIKVAIYGLVRFILDVFRPELWWGILLLIFGSISAVLGVIYALKEHDIKKLLAYHSIENIGIIVLGLGLYIIFVVNGFDVLASLSLYGALFHTLNHAIFKSLLFMTAGSVVQVTGTRNIEKMGGLVKTMPRTASLFLLGACAISALPPLNGFASEIMLFQAYLGSFALNRPLLEALLVTGLAVLALTSALAAACFAKAFGTIFLARPRSEDAKNAREVPFAMIFAPGILAALCVGLGVFSHQIISRVRTDLPIPDMLPVGIVLAVITALTVILVRLVRAPVRKTETWGCGIPLQTGAWSTPPPAFRNQLLRFSRPSSAQKRYRTANSATNSRLFPGAAAVK